MAEFSMHLNDDQIQIKDWIHQFAVIEYNDNMFNVTPVNIVNDRFIYNGKEFSL